MPKVNVPETILAIAEDVYKHTASLGLSDGMHGQARASASMIINGHSEDCMVLRLVDALLQGQIRARHMATALKRKIGQPDYVPYVPAPRERVSPWSMEATLQRIW